MALEFNLPSKDDPDAFEKLVTILNSLSDSMDRKSKNFPPIKNPLDGNQHGDVWFDEETHELKVYTKDGVKTVKYV